MKTLEAQELGNDLLDFMYLLMHYFIVYCALVLS